MDRTTSPWRALEDPGGSAATGEPARDQPFRPEGRWLLAGALAAAFALAGVVVLLGSSGSAVVSVNAAGGDSPALSPGDGPGSVVAGGDGGGSTGQNPDPSGELPTVSDGAAASDPPDRIVVEVAGAVARPGLYHLAAGARVADAIAAAGGYGPRIDIARATAELNLAARVADGDRILVPSRDDPAGAGSGSSLTQPGSSAPVRAGPVNLNTATAEELDALPGVGPVTVAKIIASRTAHAFRSVDDLLSRKLVGAAEFAKIKKLVSVG